MIKTIVKKQFEIRDRDELLKLQEFTKYNRPKAVYKKENRQYICKKADLSHLPQEFQELLKDKNETKCPEEVVKQIELEKESGFNKEEIVISYNDSIFICDRDSYGLWSPAIVEYRDPVVEVLYECEKKLKDFCKAFHEKEFTNFYEFLKELQYQTDEYCTYSVLKDGILVTIRSRNDYHSRLADFCTIHIM
jgi:hypothetical protein